MTEKTIKKSIEKVEKKDNQFKNYLVKFDDGLLLSIGIASDRVGANANDDDIRAKMKKRLTEETYEIIEKVTQTRASL